MVRESIAERRRVWFALVSRAMNDKHKTGSVSVLGWLWEKEGGEKHRKQVQYGLKWTSIMEVPRIDDATREKMLAKVEKEAADEGVPLPGRGGSELPEPAKDLPGVPNWEIE